MAGEKRGFAESSERLELGSKKPKMRDLNSIFHSSERMKEEDAERVVDTAPIGLDLNANIAADRNVVGNETQACVKETDKVTVFRRQEIECGVASKSKVFGLDLNAEDVSSSINTSHFLPCKNLDHLKSKDDSECASSVGSLEERDPLRVWKEMKKNGFLSSSHGCPSIPKPRGRKAKTDGIKKKIEIAKREQVDKFAKIASPCGLLNGLNPGIINHVRNSKQVHCIIEALVKTEKDESFHAVSEPRTASKSETKQFMIHKYEKEVVHNPGEYQGSVNRSVSMTSNSSRRDGPLCMIEPHTFGVTTTDSHFNSDFEDRVLELKLSSSTRVQSENISSVSNKDSANKTSVHTLSVKAASVASQWLELLHQDVEGRLEALRCSKKRLREVIHTELPCILSREYPSTQESNFSTTKTTVSHSDNATAEMHRTRWGSLFYQMDVTLSEEEKQLEIWLTQVKQMQVHCDMGLFNNNAANRLPQIDNVDISYRSKKADKSEKDLSVRAAAASIYSTCNFLSSMENLPCC